MGFSSMGYVYKSLSVALVLCCAASSYAETIEETIGSFSKGISVNFALREISGSQSELPRCAELPCNFSLKGKSYQINGEPFRASNSKVGFIATVSENGVPHATLSATFQYVNEFSLFFEASRQFASSSGGKNGSAKLPLPNQIGFTTNSSVPRGFIPDISIPEIVYTTFLLLLTPENPPPVTVAPACVDRTFPPMACEAPVTGTPLFPIASEAGEKCCRKHDQCIRNTHNYGEQLACDGALLACAGSIAGGLNAPYALGVALITSLGGPFFLTYDNGDCWCEWELPEEIDQMISNTVQAGMTVQASQCCSAEGDCKAGAKCGVVVTGRRPGTTLSRRIRWEGVCKKKA